MAPGVRYARAVHRGAAVLMLVALACCPGAGARAQTAECDDSSVQGVTPLEVTPGDGATSVARDATVIVRFARAADLDGLLRQLAVAADTDPCARALVCLFRDSGSGPPEIVPGHTEQLDARSAAFVPDALLAASSHHFAAIARPGFDNAARTEVEFDTGDDVDREAPRFDPAQSAIDLEVDSPPPECEAPPGSMRVRLGVPRARDDADEESVRILLFLTRAEGLDAPLLRARARNPDSGRAELRFLLTPEQARAPVCVVLRAIDGAGKLSQGEPELCFDPSRGSHFAGCSAARPGAGTMAAGAWTLVPWCAVLAALRRRRTRGLLQTGRTWIA